MGPLARASRPDEIRQQPPRQVRRKARRKARRPGRRRSRDRPRADVGDGWAGARGKSERIAGGGRDWTVKKERDGFRVSGDRVERLATGIDWESPDAAAYFQLLLQKNGVDPKKDIKLVEVGFAVSEDALRQGRVDAVNMNQPFAARAEAKGGTRKLFSLSEEMPNIVHILEACRADFVDKNPDLVKTYVRDITSGMKKALANREETLKVVSEVLKAPVSVLDTYLLKENDFGRDPGAAPNFDAIQKMLDIYAATGMLPKMDVAQFKHPTIVAPLQ